MQSFAGQGDCTMWTAAIVMFILAAVYAGVYTMYLGVIMHGQFQNWRYNLVSGNYSQCCVDTSVILSDKIACCKGKGPCNGVLPHGCLFGRSARPPAPARPRHY